MGIFLRHRREHILGIAAAPFDQIDDGEIRVRLQMLRRVLDFAKVRGDRIVRAVHPREQIATEIVDAVQMPHFEIVRATLCFIACAQRFIEFPFGALNLGEQQN